jgi:hypothetical protein
VERVVVVAATVIRKMAQVWLGFILSLDACALVEARHPSTLARVCCIYVVGRPGMGRKCNSTLDALH